MSPGRVPPGPSREGRSIPGRWGKAEPVDFLHGKHVPVSEVVERSGQAWPVVGVEFAGDLLLEHLDADRVQRVVLTSGLLRLGADADQSDESHDRPPFCSLNAFAFGSERYRFANGFPNNW